MIKSDYIFIFRPINVDLTGNPLLCSCECLPFFQWLATTKVLLVGMAAYTCAFNDGKVMTLRELNTIIIKLEAKCYNTLWLELNVAGILFAYSLITLVTMTWRFRHEVKYSWLKMRMNR